MKLSNLIKVIFYKIYAKYSIKNGTFLNVAIYFLSIIAQTGKVYVSFSLKNNLNEEKAEKNLFFLIDKKIKVSSIELQTEVVLMQL